MNQQRLFTIDVEDWYHILDAPGCPPLERWAGLESRLERNLRVLLALMDRHRFKATLFWLGWVAERHPQLVRECHQAGHEIANHGYAHVLAYQVGREVFHSDVAKAKAVIEDIIGAPVRGYRTPGFGITAETPWAFDIIAELGHTYDSSVFPARRGHGGLAGAPLGPYVIPTRHGPLHEIPLSVVEIAGRRLMLFGGGYLRLAPMPLVRWGCRQLAGDRRPVVIYIHPREIDPAHPRLPLPWARYFKCYVNLRSTHVKLEHLCREGTFLTMSEWLKQRASPVDERLGIQPSTV